jgi:hypothetical protein
VKQIFEDRIGRKPRQSELDAIAGDLSGYYEVAQEGRIALHRTAWEERNQDRLTTGELKAIEQPGAATYTDIENKWANEIDLNARREDNKDSMSRILRATMGGRPAGIGGVTPALGVTQITRNR